MWFHMGIFPMNTLATSHSHPVSWCYGLDPLLMLKAWCFGEVMGTCPWRRCCDPDTSSPHSLLSSHHEWAASSAKPLFSSRPCSSSPQSHRHLCKVTMDQSLWNWAKLNLSLKVISPQVFVKVTGYWLIHMQHSVIISPYNLITFIIFRYSHLTLNQDQQSQWWVVMLCEWRNAGVNYSAANSFIIITPPSWMSISVSNDPMTPRPCHFSQKNLQ